MSGAGERRALIGFERRPYVSEGDGAGNYEGEFAEVFAAKARLKPLGGTEAVMAARLDERQPFVLTVRSTAETRSVRTDWRAKNKRTGEIYNIRSISNFDERDREIDILVERGPAT